jgi:solute carrier family 25 phosphate transporter 3
MGKQVSFDFLCTLAVDLLRRSGVPVALAGRLAPMLAALPAAVLAAVLSHPGDVLLTEFYKGGSGGEESSSLLESLRSVVRKRGVGGLLVGLQALYLYLYPCLSLYLQLSLSLSLSIFYLSIRLSILSIYQARLVHVIGIIWVQLIIYDSIKQGLGLPATGH